MSKPTDISEIDKRPLLITIICVWGFIAFFLALLGFVVRGEQLVQRYGSSFLPLSLFGAFLGIAGLIGYWKMRRWGIYLYASSFIFGSIASHFLGIPLGILSYVVPLSFLAVGLAYFKRMRWKHGPMTRLPSPRPLSVKVITLVCVLWMTPSLIRVALFLYKFGEVPSALLNLAFALLFAIVGIGVWRLSHLARRIGIGLACYGLLRQLSDLWRWFSVPESRATLESILSSHPFSDGILILGNYLIPAAILFFLIKRKSAFGKREK